MSYANSRKAAIGVLILGLLVFAVSLLAVIGLNGRASVLSADASAAITVTGRQRSFLQNIVRDLDQIQLDLVNKAKTTEDLDDLNAKIAIFDNTNVALTKGSVVYVTPGVARRLKAIDAAQGREDFVAAQKLWLPIREGLKPILAGDLTRVGPIADQARAQLGTIWDYYDTVVGKLANTAGARTAALSFQRNLVIGVAVLGVLIANGGLLGVILVDARERRRIEAEAAAELAAENQRLADATRALELAQRNTDAIMQTVRQGLMLIDENQEILPGYSAELENIFGVKAIAGRELTELLKPYVTEKMLDATKRYMKLVFDPNRKERAVIQVNPLTVLDVHFTNADATFTTKSLEFGFRRVVDQGKIVNAFVAIADVTERVTHERELLEAEELKEKQFQLLVGVLHVEPAMLDEFIHTAQDDLAKMNDSLRAEEFASGVTSATALRERLDVVFRSAHNIKGNAAFLKLDYFTRACDRFESEIAALREKRVLSGDDFLAIVLTQSNLRNDLKQLIELRERFIGLRSHAPAGGSAAPPQAEERFSDPVVAGVAELVRSIAHENGKHVTIKAADFTLDPLAPEHRRFVKDALIQLGRNSIVHGVETPVVRSKAGKPEVATIDIRRVESDPGTFAFVFRDDGRGLDPEALRAKAIEKGIVTAEQAADMDDVAAIDLIFAPGFSTAETPNVDAGRGMGMDIVRQSMVDECGGRLTIRSKTGKWCEFRFVLPAQAAGSAAA